MPVHLKGPKNTEGRALGLVPTTSKARTPHRDPGSPGHSEQSKEMAEIYKRVGA